MTDLFQSHMPDDAPSDHEGVFDPQMSLPLPSMEAPQPFSTIIKRDGRQEPFDKRKIARAIYSAAQTVGGQDEHLAQDLASAVSLYLSKVLKGQAPSVDQVHDAVERVLIQMSHVKTALAYARYRDRRARIRRLRQGDVRALLSELEEARHEREAIAGAPSPLFVRTSAETLTSWDNRQIVDALIRETGLDYAMAWVVALEVEQQIQTAGIKTLTTSLVRELVGAKLIEHGFGRHRERHRRLGVPLYDMERIIRGNTPETMGQGPEATDRVLARAVKKEYALAEVYSPRVAEAHLRGDFHVSALGQVDRLYTARHSLECIIRYGIGLPGSRTFADPPHYPETLLAQMVKASEIYQQLFSGEIRWDAVNIFFAPFLQGLQEKELRQLAQMLVYEFAFRALTQREDHPTVVLGLCWTVPPWLKSREALGPSGIPTGKTYGDYLHTAQQFAWTVVDVFHKGGGDGESFPSPVPEVMLGIDFFRADGNEVWLNHVCKIAALRRSLRFSIERPRQPHDTAASATWQASNAASQEIVLNLPRAAYKAGKESALYDELQALLDLVLLAHEEKRNFLEHLLDSQGTGPLGLLSVRRDGHRYVDLDHTAWLVGIEGLNECVQVLMNAEAHRNADAAALAQRILAFLREKCAARGVTSGLRVLLSQNNDESVSNRFATLDLKAYPRTARTTVKPNPATQALQYTLGARLNWVHDLNPAEGARLEGAFHMELSEGAMLSVPLPHDNTAPSSIADFLRKAFHQSAVQQVTFE